MCYFGVHHWLFSLSLLVLFAAIVVASVVFLARELNRPAGKQDK